MSIAFWNELQAAKARITELETALADRVTQGIQVVEHATKDDLDAVLARMRGFESKLEAIAKRVKV